MFQLYGEGIVVGKDDSDNYHFRMIHLRYISIGFKKTKRQSYVLS